MTTTQATLDRQALLNLVYVHYLVEGQPPDGCLPANSSLPDNYRFLCGSISCLSRSDQDFLQSVQNTHDHAVEQARASTWTFEAYFEKALSNGLIGLAHRYQLQLPSIATAA